MDHSENDQPPTFPEGPRCPYCNSDRITYVMDPEVPTCYARASLKCKDCGADHEGRSVFNKTHPKPPTTDQSPYT